MLSCPQLREQRPYPLFYYNHQGPLSEELTILVIDTNILLEFLEVIQVFVSEVEEQGLPVLLVIPGAVIYELDG